MTDMPAVATFKLEHDQLLAITHKIDSRIIAPIERLKRVVDQDVTRLGTLVNAHTELAKVLYEDSFAEGKITVASQTFSIAPDQVKDMAIQRAQELSDKIDLYLTRIRGVETVIGTLEEEVIKILKSITVGGKPLA